MGSRNIKQVRTVNLSQGRCSSRRYHSPRSQHLVRRSRALSHGGGGSYRSNSGRNGSSAVAVDLSLGAVARDVAGFTTAVAGLTRGVERAAVRGRAIAGDVTKLAAGVALHGLSLAVAGEMVRSAALVASGRTAASESTPEAAESTTRSASATSNTSARIGAVTGQVASETTGVASSARASAAQPKSRAVSLDVTEALAVVALLCFGGAGVRASVGLVAGLLACIRSVDWSVGRIARG